MVEFLSVKDARAKREGKKVTTSPPGRKPGEQVATCDYCGQPLDVNVDWCKEHPKHLPTLFELRGDEANPTKERMCQHVSVQKVRGVVYRFKCERPATHFDKARRERCCSVHRIPRNLQMAYAENDHHHTLILEQENQKGNNTVKPKKKKKAPRSKGRKLKRSRKVKTSPRGKVKTSHVRTKKGKKKVVTTARAKVKTSNTTAKKLRASRTVVGHLADCRPAQAAKPEPPKPKKCTRPEPHCRDCKKRPKPEKDWRGNKKAGQCRNCGLGLERLRSGKRDGFYYRHEQYPNWRNKPELPKGWKPCTN